jgi:hypothetical protein
LKHWPLLSCNHFALLQLLCNSCFFYPIEPIIALNLASSFPRKHLWAKALCNMMCDSAFKIFGSASPEVISQLDISRELSQHVQVSGFFVFHLFFEFLNGGGGIF